jgi:hypothetical protein
MTCKTISPLSLFAVLSPLAAYHAHPLDVMQVANQDSLMAPFMALFAAHRSICEDALTTFFSMAAPSVLSAAAFAVQQFITLRLYCHQELDHAVASGAELLGVLHAANARAAESISHETFYNDVVNSKDFDLSEDFRRMKGQFRGSTSRRGQLFSFCRCAFCSISTTTTWHDSTPSACCPVPGGSGGIGCGRLNFVSFTQEPCDF